MSTRAIIFLKQRRIRFETVCYQHFEKGAEFAARATGFALERTVKTLVVKIAPQRHVLALVAGDRQLDLKAMARFLSVKKTELSDSVTAERLTGYHVGGISPFGIRQALPVIMDKGILAGEEILINAGQRGMMLKMSPADICAALNCKVAAISTPQDEAG